MGRHEHLVRRLSALPGPGTPRDYLQLLGPTLDGILEEAGDLAGALVERQLASSTYRPTPAELRTTWLAMTSEAGQRRDESIRQRSRRCPYCEGRGQVHAWVRTRIRGAERVRTYAVTCSCPRGLQLAQKEGERRMDRAELETTAQRQRAANEWADGVVALYVDDATKGARPEWTRWAPAVEPPATGGNLRTFQSRR